MIVVKVGGSLYDWPGLGPALRAFVAALDPAPVLLVPGGGDFADAVRKLHGVHGLTEEQSHWLALESLWAPAGFLGDELPSDKFPNDRLLKDALAKIRAGDILMAHLGIWSRADPYAPMLDPLIAGLKARGLCFATLREHPDYRH